MCIDCCRELLLLQVQRMQRQPAQLSQSSFNFISKFTTLPTQPQTVRASESRLANFLLLFADTSRLEGAMAKNQAQTMGAFEHLVGAVTDPAAKLNLPGAGTAAGAS